MPRHREDKRPTKLTLAPWPPVPVGHAGIIKGIGESNIGADATLHSHGCHLAFGPMQPDIGADFTRGNASKIGEMPSNNGRMPSSNGRMPSSNG